MALEIKPTFISQSRDGREIVIKDSTGLESNGRLTGYGVNNGSPESILAYHISLSRLYDTEEHWLKIDGSEELLPTPTQLAYGTPLTLSTGLFKTQTERGILEPDCIFFDGALDVNIYIEFVGLTGLVIEKDTNYIVASQNRLGDALKGDAIVVNGKVYEINKSPEYWDNGNQALYIVGKFEEDATSFNILYRGNLKVLLTGMSEVYHNYACVQLKDSPDSPEWTKVNVAASFREAARGLFNSEVPDPYRADELVQSNFRLLKRYAI